MVDYFQNTGMEKRIHKRLRLKFQVEIENLDNHSVYSLISRDIGVGGLGISMLAPESMEIFLGEELSPDVPVGIKLILPGCEREILLKGKVKWSERSKTGIWKAGIQFEEPQIVINKYYFQDKKDAVAKYDHEKCSYLFQVEIRKVASREVHIALSVNLDVNGMQLFSDILFSTDTPVEVRMHIFGTDEKLTIRGSILWARQEEGATWRMGIKFDEPFPLDKISQL